MAKQQKSHEEKYGKNMRQKSSKICVAPKQSQASGFFPRMSLYPGMPGWHGLAWMVDRMHHICECFIDCMRKARKASSPPLWVPHEYLTAFHVRGCGAGVLNHWTQYDCQVQDGYFRVWFQNTKVLAKSTWAWTHNPGSSDSWRLKTAPAIPHLSMTSVFLTIMMLIKMMMFVDMISCCYVCLQWISSKRPISRLWETIPVLIPMNWSESSWVLSVLSFTTFSR